MAVLAFVVDLVKNPNTKKEYYQPIYQFEINGEVYTVEGLTFIDKFIPKIGESIKLYVDSKNYTDVYFDKSKREKIYSMGVGLFLMIASLVILISLFI